MRVVSRLTRYAVGAPGPEWEMSQFMSSALLARRLAWIAHSSHCGCLMSFLGGLVDSVPSIFSALLLLMLPLRCHLLL